ncbi:hypothetical protein CIK05_01845 [Bdellovibrio sp. qaytius]|nr:hypothetical protein CIK05_01845 [Bdellovibrio sp. qaytius]
MKALVVVLSLTLSSIAFANCGSETVDFGNCGAQIYANGGAAIGSTQIAMDPMNGGEARLVCTEKGWKYTAATCNAGLKIECIKDKLNAYNSDNFYDITKEEITDMLSGVSRDARAQDVVDKSNLCDSGR